PAQAGRRRNARVPRSPEGLERLSPARRQGRGAARSHPRRAARPPRPGHRPDEPERARTTDPDRRLRADPADGLERLGERHADDRRPGRRLRSDPQPHAGDVPRACSADPRLRLRDVPDPEGAPRLRRLAVAAAAAFALTAPGAAYAYAPNDPFVSRQWYLSADHAFDFWPTLPGLPSVRVAVIDSGIDGTHPEFAGKIAAARSFVGGSALTDEQGHGTFVAGEIAAATGNGEGIAAVAPSTRLLV